VVMHYIIGNVALIILYVVTKVPSYSVTGRGEDVDAKGTVCELAQVASIVITIIRAKLRTIKYIRK
jgi:hypothetical protein